jgi:putative endonuclease
MKQHSYYLYITTNPKKTVLYTGVTNDLERRLQEHLDDHLGERKSFAGKNFCYNLVYYEWYQYIQAAIGREKEIKGWLRAKKEKLIATFNPDWRFLNDPFEIAKGNLPIWCIGDDYWRPNLDGK